jgi:hypothetical protein
MGTNLDRSLRVFAVALLTAGAIASAMFGGSALDRAGRAAVQIAEPASEPAPVLTVGSIETGGIRR